MNLRHSQGLRALVIAGTQSGVGKTSVTLGLIRALGRRGMIVQPFKVGPDFIDPGHHTLLAGRVSRNLDGWMLSREGNLEIFHHNAKEADISIIEGVMGLYDGFDGSTDTGSTAQMAKWLGVPVVLVLDARSMARSAAALVLGFSSFDREVSFAGVLFNRIGSETHLCYLKQAMAQIEGMGCLGGIPRDDAISMPERHLGLVTGEESPLSGAQIERLADLVERNVDLTALMDKATSAVPKITDAPLSPWREGGDVNTRGRGRARIGVARDEAFCFYYQDNLDWLAHYGAEIVSFSPLRDPQVPERLDGVYLGGGYPELFAECLAENVHMKQSLLKLAREDIPIYAECGGLMYLSREIEDMAGRIYPMVGALPLQVRMGARLRSLGYREITFKTDTILGPTGTRVRGHEFHYSDIVDAPADLACAFGASRRNGGAQRLEGYSFSKVLASYVHLHFGSNPDVARFFVENCAAQRRPS